MALAVAIAIMVIMFLAIVYVPKGYLEKLDWKWFRFSLISIAFFMYSLKTYWQLRSSPAFWCIFTSFLFLHAFGVGHFYYIGRGLNTLEVALVAGAEWGFMALIIYRWLRVPPDFRENPHRSRWTPTL
jgi:hypothetical protein